MNKALGVVFGTTPFYFLLILVSFSIYTEKDDSAVSCFDWSKEPEGRREWMLVIFDKAGMSNSNNKNFQIWRQDNHPIELFTNSVINQKKEYIHLNPVRAGIVANAEDYIYSSARNYSNMECVPKIEKI